jgi:hypothetical protein
VVSSGDVHDDLSVEDVGSFVDIGVQVEWRGLSAHLAGFEQEQHAAGLSGSRFEGEQATAREPAAVSFSTIPDHRDGDGHGVLLARRRAD